MFSTTTAIELIICLNFKLLWGFDESKRLLSKIKILDWTQKCVPSFSSLSKRAFFLFYLLVLLSFKMPCNCWNLALLCTDLSFLMRRLTVQTAVVVPPPLAVILQNIQHPGYLTENQNPRILCFQSNKQFIQKNHLSSVVNQVLVRCVWGS